MDDVKTTKLLIQKLRDNGWSKLKTDVLSFCAKHGVKTPDFASKFYPADFEEQEREILRCQLRHYEHDILVHPKFQNLTTISELCQQLAATGKNDDYHLIDRLIRLVLTLPVSTATTERAFSAMKLVKTRLRNKMDDGFLRDCLVTYIEKEIAVGISTDAIIDEFDEAPRRVDFN
ncbi:uncharacterized protein LOC124682718 [Lolium rigidum]|uniref:uncharacterized protein LOC124682718 n=1 Tax=Lolium rigidum TaxID=89674 RepID=UPI001F5C345E|nr:uncharacterized protein LOC124682718 [Lolium rigidum]